ncbi:DNA mismatch repair protein MutS [Candidatus Karelsulcia muelleri PSPU]|uniref:DNA mismatch repair protein MutS n=3 Tax=Candidatus Karelsulcia muelleri TaxID=336810 RepID=A0AAD1EXA8_9FLAO|nr:DNA mismatch repair protein MutS [Candidatus Karelsulcia muelleri PSPU]
MRQYFEIRNKYPDDTLILFRVGDFYEMFGNDAIQCSKILNIVLTKRNKNSSIELAGFPYHSIDNYLPKLIKSGFRVAICDQLEKKKKNKKIINRGVTEIITPGVIINSEVLESKTSNFLAAIHIENKNIGISFLDISTGEFFVGEGYNSYVDQFFKKFNPNEVLYKKNKKSDITKIIGNKYYSNGMEDWVFDYLSAYENLLRHFKTNSLKVFNIETFYNGIIAAGAILNYVCSICNIKISHISNITKLVEDEYVSLDDFTLENLEIIKSKNEKAITLINILDNTISPMGGRLLKKWMTFPLKNIFDIKKRHKIVSLFLNNKNIYKQISKKIINISDIERLTSKIVSSKVNPHDLILLSISLKKITDIKNLLLNSKIDELKNISYNIKKCDNIYIHIEKILSMSSTNSINKGNIILPGFSKKLDEFRNILNSSKEYINNIYKREKKNTGIKNLKILFNNIFGFYIEIKSIYKNKVPSHWILKQKLFNCERYITDELKNHEMKILSSKEKILYIEKKIFSKLIDYLSKYTDILQFNSKSIAEIDILMSFAKCAIANNYIRPELNKSFNLYIKDGRHPVIEKQIYSYNKSYIPNDIIMNNNDSQIIIITGPNMSGKSAILRQTALIILMAQIGSYVPASYASIGIVDKIFSRVGSSDNISMGESTFMKEMNETASIINNLSYRSLLILDEIGRGTSNDDGISLAWSIIEFLNKNIHKPKTLFATHYHELNNISNYINNIKNYSISVKIIDENLIFTRKLLNNISNKSYGIHIAKIAGMPDSIINRANELYSIIEKKNINVKYFYKKKNIYTFIKNLNVEKITPIEAINSLYEIKKNIKYFYKKKNIYTFIKNLNVEKITPIEAINSLYEIKKFI